MPVNILKFIIVLAGCFFAASAKAQSLAPPATPGPVRLIVSQDSTASARPFNFLSNDHYVRNLSFVCKQEWKMEKVLRLPLRIRMGSLEQCNYLEGK